MSDENVLTMAKVERFRTMLKEMSVEAANRDKVVAVTQTQFKILTEERGRRKEPREKSFVNPMN